MERKRVVLDLCAGTGSWSRPYDDDQDHYTVLRFSLPWSDVRLMQKVDFPVHGILMAPPCTYFASSGAWVKRSDEDYLEAMSVVDACLRAVFVYKPKWWVLENPVGTLTRWLGKPRFMFDPCDFGDPWTKKTCLWG